MQRSFCCVGLLTEGVFTSKAGWPLDGEARRVFPFADVLERATRERGFRHVLATEAAELLDPVLVEDAVAIAAAAVARTTGSQGLCDSPAERSWVSPGKRGLPDVDIPSINAEDGFADEVLVGNIGA